MRWKFLLEKNQNMCLATDMKLVTTSSVCLWLIQVMLVNRIRIWTLIRVCCACKDGHCQLVTSLQLSVVLMLCRFCSNKNEQCYHFYQHITSYSATVHTLCIQQFLSAISLKILFDHIQDLLCFNLKCFEIWKPRTHICIHHTSPFDNDTRSE